METGNKNKKFVKIIIIFLFIVTLFLATFLEMSKANHLVINEVAFSSEDGVDWIEIYNPTMNNLSLENLYLSDNATDFSKFKIDNQVIVPSGGFVVIYCDGYEQTEEGEIVTNFRISNGETVYLVASDGSTVIDSMTVAVDDGSDVTIGRFPDGGDNIFIMSQKTPEEANKKDMSVVSLK